MLFIVQFEDVYADQPDRLPERATHMPSHLAFLARHGEQVVAAGALREAAEGAPHGGIWIVSADDKAAVEALYKKDPFWTAGLRKSVRVSHWAKAFWSLAFTDCVGTFDNKEPPATRRLISSGSLFEADIGYSRAVVDGDLIFVSGTTGFDYDAMTISSDVRQQAEQTMRNIGHALAEAGSSLADVVRVRYILPDAADFEPCWPVLRHHFGKVRPAATMIAAGLADPRMKIEIEVTARRTAC